MRSPRLALRREDDEVSALELFFDLVYVFAISQFSQLLLHDRTIFGVAQAVVLYAAVFSVWMQTSFSACLHDTSQRHMQGVLLAIMIAGLFMNAAVGSAFDKTPLLFVGLYLLINLGRDLWLMARSESEQLRDHYLRMNVWHVLGGVFWIAGALAGREYRLALWGSAAAIDIAGNLFAHPLPRWRMAMAELELPRERLLERARLFFIIALGETVLTTGTAIQAHLTDPLALFAGFIAVGGTIALWWAYFDAREGAVQHALEHSANPTQTVIWTYSGLFMVVAALIAIAVADEIVIAHPHGHLDAFTAALLYGGPMLYLLTHAWHSWRAAGKILGTRLVAAAVLALLGAVATWMPPVVAIAGAVAPLVVVAFLDTWGARIAAKRGCDKTAGMP